MLEQSLGELQITVQELEKKADSVDDESRSESLARNKLLLDTVCRNKCHDKKSITSQELSEKIQKLVRFT